MGSFNSVMGTQGETVPKTRLWHTGEFPIFQKENILLTEIWDSHGKTTFTKSLLVQKWYEIKSEEKQDMHDMGKMIPNLFLKRKEEYTLNREKTKYIKC